MYRNNDILGVDKKFNFSPKYSDGFYLYDDKKQKVLDFATIFGSLPLGHSSQIIEKALISQLHCGFLSYSNTLYNDVAEKLSNKLCELAGFYEYKNQTIDVNGKSLFFNSATDANECAIKLARKRYNLLCDREYNEIICFKNSNHGNSITTLSASSNNTKTISFKPLQNCFKFADINNISSVESLINEHTCAVMLETIQTDQEVVCCNDDFLKKLRQLCTKHEIALILDETHCCSGRSGTFFAYEKSGIKPDIVTISGGFVGGLPFSACIANNQITEFLQFSDFGTSDGNILLCNIGLKVINEINNIDFLDNVKKNGQLLKQYLEQICKRYSDIAYTVNGMGLMLGLKIRNEVNATKLSEILLSNGLLVEQINNTLLFFPPLNIGEQQIKEAIKILITSIEEISVIERY